MWGGVGRGGALLGCGPSSCFTGTGGAERGCGSGSSLRVGIGRRRSVFRSMAIGSDGGDARRCIITIGIL